MKNFLRRVCPMSIARTRRTFALAAIATLAASPTRDLAAQSLEGSKWTVEQEGVETPALWWLGGQGRVRVGEFGTILTGYSWRQAGDSVFISVGDTVRYSALLMSNRLVGVRTGPRRQEGWWSGVRADGPTALAQGTPTTPPAAEPMSRPSDEAPVTTPARGTEPAAQPGGRRPLRQIERAGTNTPAPQSGNAPSGGREIRRIERTGNTPTRAVEAARLIGRWVHTNPNTGIALDLRADSTFTFVRRDASTQEGRWRVDATGLYFRVDLIGGEAKDVDASLDGSTLILQPRGGLLRLTLTRGQP
jgi:hypothetical protein